MHRTTRSSIAAGVGLTLALIAGQTPAGATSGGYDGYWNLDSMWKTVTQITDTTAVKPLLGDFNGDDLQDVFFYAAGAGTDYLWLAKAHSSSAASDRFASSTALSVSGTYQPIVGDFDGNGSSDIFWYAPGGAPDSIWYFDGGTVSSSVNRSVGGTYAPVVANFDATDTDDSNSKDDIFWYASGGSSSLWSGNTDRTFTGRTFSTQPPAGAQALLGNWTVDPDGSYDLDLLFYASGTGADSIWQGDGTGAFTPTAKTIDGKYITIVGNFDRSSDLPPVGEYTAGLTDIVWYAPGTGTDTVWMNRGTGFTSTHVTIAGTSFKPFVVPNIMGGDTIMWNNPAGADARWQTYGTDGTFAYASTGWPGTDKGTRTPMVGMFDDDLGNLAGDVPVGADVVWYGAGTGSGKYEWFWAGNDGGRDAWLVQTVN